MALSSVVCIPVYALYKISRSPGATFREVQHPLTTVSAKRVSLYGISALKYVERTLWDINHHNLPAYTMATAQQTATCNQNASCLFTYITNLQIFVIIRIFPVLDNSCCLHYLAACSLARHQSADSKKVFHVYGWVWIENRSLKY